MFTSYDSCFDLLVETKVSVDSVLYVQLNGINNNVNIKAFYYLALFVSSILQFKWHGL